MTSCIPTFGFRKTVIGTVLLVGRCLYQLCTRLTYHTNRKHCCQVGRGSARTMSTYCWLMRGGTEEFDRMQQVSVQYTELAGQTLRS